MSSVSVFTAFDYSPTSTHQGDEQRVAVCCSALQCVAVCCSALQCIAVYCLLQCVTVRCSALQYKKGTRRLIFLCSPLGSPLVAVCYSVLQCVAVRCSKREVPVDSSSCVHRLLQCVTACCSALQCVVVKERYLSTHLFGFTTGSYIWGRKRIKHHHLCHMTHSHLWTLSITKVRLVLQKLNQNPKKAPYVFGAFFFGEQRDQHHQCHMTHSHL